MNKKERENPTVKEIRLQWGFVVIGIAVAVFTGVAVNALYDLIKIFWSPLHILVVYGSGIFITVGLVDFYFKHLQEYGTGTPGYIIYLNFLKSIFLRKK